ncbi:hypothetical protein Tco_0647488 [Tanacetum coccineum]
MAGNTVKEMTTNFGKLDKFEGHDFRRWQKKMHFLLDYFKGVIVDNTKSDMVGDLQQVKGVSEVVGGSSCYHMKEEVGKCWNCGMTEAHFKKGLAVDGKKETTRNCGWFRERGTKTNPKTKVNAIGGG